MKANIRQYGISGLDKTVHEIANKFQKDTGWILPKFKIIYKPDYVTTEVRWNEKDNIYNLIIYIRHFPQHLIGRLHNLY